jgi:hypothetical protein
MSWVILSRALSAAVTGTVTLSGSRTAAEPITLAAFASKGSATDKPSGKQDG